MSLLEVPLQPSTTPFAVDRERTGLLNVQGCLSKSELSASPSRSRLPCSLPPSPRRTCPIPSRTTTLAFRLAAIARSGKTVRLLRSSTRRFLLSFRIDFRVDVASLPNVTFASALNGSFAGNIAVNRPGHPNDTLFFWAFESEKGSLTADDCDDKPWAVWLNGGCAAARFCCLMHTSDLF